MMKHWKRVLSAAVLAGSVLLGGCGGGGASSVPAASAAGSKIPPCSATAASSQTENTGPDESSVPVLKLRINEKSWISQDLTEYLGQENAWVTIPVDIGLLEAGYNQLAVHSNAYNHGNRTEKSLDLYSTLRMPAMDSFLSTDVMESWEMMEDRTVNIRLELYNGTDWVTYPKEEEYKQDESVVVGLFVPQDTVYNVCRNVDVESLDSYTQARVAVNLHVGSTLLEAPEPEPEEEPDVPSPLDTTAPVLKVRLNGTVWERYDLTPEKGKNDTWVTVPLNFEKMRTGTNRIAVDSNVNNRGHLTDQSINLYFTQTATPGDSFVSTDNMASWIPYTDRYANIYLELKKTGTEEWVKVLPEETYTLYESTVVGLFTGSDPASPYHMRREIVVESLEGYDGVRAVVNLHVGGDLELNT